MIDLLPNAEQEAVRDSFAAALAAAAPVSRLRKPDNDDRTLFSDFAKLGWFGLGLSEAQGGVGYSAAEEVLMMREAGRQLLGPDFLATVLGARIAASAGASDLAAELVSGARAACLLAPADGFHHAFGIASDAVGVTWDANAGAVFGVDALAQREDIACLDDSLKLSRVTLPAAQTLARSGANAERFDLRADLLFSAMFVGIAEAARDMAVAYAKTRQQFGQPIGAFQAIKHTCADMAVQCEAAWSLTVFAALALEDKRPDATFQVSSAWLIAARAAKNNSRRNIQVHGGMGYTAECDAQAYAKRAQVMTALFGGERARKARLLAAPPPTDERT